jgi:predicted N-formylglutamate amidohydrolase
VQNELLGAVELVRPSRADAPVVISCEHASGRIPEPWSLSEVDRWLEGSHWAVDIGARELVFDLCESTGAEAVLARFSRLLADPNRDESSPELFLRHAEGREIALNREIDASERERRLATLWRAYHAAVDRAVASSAAPVLLAVHTFTPVFAGARRELEVGVLFDHEEELADRFVAALAAEGVAVERNEPYSGRRGLMYSAERHARAHEKRPIELELRQDLAVLREFRARVTAAVRRALAA